MSSRVEQVLVAGAILCCLMASMAWAAEEEEQQEVAEGRTFGHHFLKRLSFATVPAAFVIGVITTLLSALTIVSMKGLGVGVILLVLAVSQILARSFPTALPPPPITYAAPAPGPLPLVYHRDW
ncbi:protein apnoia [Culex pipiens pallens]|uniref:protein apnoia n=1 Tax=Culex pipiens pallens TaxID=42434 RepID=UPI001953EC4C|nr:protein apnoia [Culex pipiens pallens]